jgi:hypothetical protein
VRVGGWAYVRRKFFEAKEENAKAVALIIKIIGRLYHQESQLDERGVRSAERQQYR